MKRVVMKKTPEMGWVDEVGKPPEEVNVEVIDSTSYGRRTVVRFRFGDKVRVAHHVKAVGNRFGVVIRSTAEGAWLIFFDQSEAYVATRDLHRASDAEWWGFLNEVSS